MRNTSQRRVGLRNQSKIGARSSGTRPVSRGKKSHLGRRVEAEAAREPSGERRRWLAKHEISPVTLSCMRAAVSAGAAVMLLTVALCGCGGFPQVGSTSWKQACTAVADIGSGFPTSLGSDHDSLLNAGYTTLASDVSAISGAVASRDQVKLYDADKVFVSDANAAGVAPPQCRAALSSPIPTPLPIPTALP